MNPGGKQKKKLMEMTTKTSKMRGEKMKKREGFCLFFSHVDYGWRFYIMKFMTAVVQVLNTGRVMYSMFVD